jgi:hypothetical protein
LLLCAKPGLTTWFRFMHKLAGAGKHFSRFWPWFFLVLASCAFAQTSTQNIAAFSAAALETKNSYHWNSMEGGVPTVATTPRTTLPYASSLTTFSFDSLNPSLYQQRVVGGSLQDCVLVGTFSNPNNFWNQASGTEVTLTYNIGAETHYIFPYVMVGNDLHSYLRSTYFSSLNPTSDDVALRIDQSLGMNPATNLGNRGLAFFWAPISNIVRSGYLPDVTTQVANLPNFGDGSYQPTETGVGTGFSYVDINDSRVLYDNNVTFVSYNQAQTTYPWTAMGYTYNWNALQDGSNPDYGFDPLAPTNAIGVAEFMVSGGSQVVLEQWVSHADLQTWIIPEPRVVVLVVLSLGVLACGQGRLWRPALRLLLRPRSRPVLMSRR